MTLAVCASRPTGSSWWPRSGPALRRCRSTWRQAAARSNSSARLAAMNWRFGSRVGRLRKPMICWKRSDSETCLASCLDSPVCPHSRRVQEEREKIIAAGRVAADYRGWEANSFLPALRDRRFFASGKPGDSEVGDGQSFTRFRALSGSGRSPPSRGCRARSIRADRCRPSLSLWHLARPSTSDTRSGTPCCLL